MSSETKKKVAIVASYEDEGDMLYYIVRSYGMEEIEVFLNAESALNKAISYKFDLFVEKQEQTDISALTLIQKLRSSGKYGLEPHLLLVNRITEEMLPLIFEHDLRFVLEMPYSEASIKDMFQHVLHMEEELSSFDRILRSARAAWYNDDCDTAKEICLDLFKEHGFHERVLTLLGEIFLKEGDLEKAHDLFDIVLRNNPKSIVAKHRLASTLMAEKNFAEASPILNELVTSNPLNINVLTDAGIANMEIGDTEHAEIAMSQMLQLDQHDHRANEIMARIAISRGKVGDACQFLKNFYNDLDMIRYLNNAGAKLAKDQDLSGAIRLYKQCLDSIKESPYLYAIHYNLGLAYQKSAQKEPAIEHFKQALLIKPDHEKAQQALARLTN